jgi:transcriptional regulator NrdR family protein
MTSLCTECGGDSEVIDSRPRPNGVIRRRRRCKSCKFAWTTEELKVQKEAMTKKQLRRLRYAAGVITRFLQDYGSEA